MKSPFKKAKKISEMTEVELNKQLKESKMLTNITFVFWLLFGIILAIQIGFHQYLGWFKQIDYTMNLIVFFVLASVPYFFIAQSYVIKTELRFRKLEKVD